MNAEGARRRLLIADDNADIQELLRDLFAGEGYEILCASDGEEAVRLTAEARPDVVILDMRMPREDGIGVLRRIRETNLDTAILLHTAFANDALAHEALREGADDCLRKPVQIDLLLERVRTVSSVKEGHNTLRHRVEQRLRDSESRYRAAAEELAARVASSEIVQEVARTVLSNLDLREVANTVASQWRRLVPYDRAVIVSVDDEGQSARVLACFDDSAEPFPPEGTKIPIQRCMLSRAAKQGRPVRVEDLDALSVAELAEMDQKMRERGVRSTLVVPLVSRDRVVGAMCMSSKAPATFTARHEALAGELVGTTGIALQNAILYRDLRESYASLERAQENLVRNERLAALGQIAAVMAHELRNPLAVIFNSLGPLRQLIRPTGDSEMLVSIIEEEADRLNRIVGSLLEFARPPVLHMRDGNLSPLVLDVVRDARSDPAMHEGIEVSSELRHDAKPFPFDEHLLRQALTHLVQNALQAIRREGKVRVRTAEVPGEGGGHVRIEVDDTGSGIRADIRDRIFEPFFTTRASGTGLGLPIVKRVVDDHAGRIELVTREGEGTSVSLLLPRTRARPIAPG
jgi:signal transduction histidine kinase/DNA-binding response OmpR family regulator